MATKQPTKILQVPGVAPVVLTAEDFNDPQLLKVNEFFRQVFTSLNVLVGANGTIPFSVGLNLQGNDLSNVGTVVASKGVTAPTATLTVPAPTVPPGQVGLGSGTAGTATAGAAPALPATPDGYLIVNIGGLQRKIAFYKP